MNEPKPRIDPADNFGPLDEEAAIARMTADPEFWAGIKEAEADIAAGRVYTHDEVVAMSAERRRRSQAERGL